MDHNDIMYQPTDVAERRFEERRFNTLNAFISFHDASGIEFETPRSNTEEQSASKHDALFGEEEIEKLFDDAEYSCTTPILGPAYDSNTPLFQDLDDSEIRDPLKNPISEITVETSSESDNTPSEMILTDTRVYSVEEIEMILRQPVEWCNLQNIDQSIKERTMSVEKQPPNNLRPRYKSDGQRQIEKARTRPMMIQLPDLKQISCENREAFHLRLGLITVNEDPSVRQYLHANQLEYHSDDAQELSDGTVCVKLTPEDIEKRSKALPRLSIVKTKFGAYKPELTPYLLTESDHTTHSVITNMENLTVKQAKKMFQKYNMKQSRITCQLMIKQNQTYYFTNITCATSIISEKEQTYKRSLTTDESEEEEHVDQRTPPRKRRKTSRT